MQKTFELRKEMGAVSLRLYTQDDNTAAQSLYKKCGFKIKGNAVFMETDQDVSEKSQFYPVVKSFAI